MGSGLSSLPPSVVNIEDFDSTHLADHARKVGLHSVAQAVQKYDISGGQLLKFSEFLFVQSNRRANQSSVHTAQYEEESPALMEVRVFVRRLFGPSYQPEKLQRGKSEYHEKEVWELADKIHSLGLHVHLKNIANTGLGGPGLAYLVGALGGPALAGGGEEEEEEEEEGGAAAARRRRRRGGGGGPVAVGPPGPPRLPGSGAAVRRQLERPSLQDQETKERAAFILWMRFLVGGKNNLQQVSNTLEQREKKQNSHLFAEKNNDLDFILDMNGEDLDAFDDDNVWCLLRDALAQAANLDEDVHDLDFEIGPMPGGGREDTRAKGQFLDFRDKDEVDAAQMALLQAVETGKLAQICQHRGLLVTKATVAFPGVAEKNHKPSLKRHDTMDLEQEEMAAAAEVVLAATGGRQTVRWAELVCRGKALGRVPAQSPLEGAGVGAPTQIDALAAAAGVSIFEEGRARELRLAWKNLTGVIAEEMAKLEKLEVVDMSGNSLKSHIPDSISAITSLKELKLGCNQFTGEIPAALGQCHHLEILDLSVNRLRGLVPLSLGQCIFLRELRLNNNALFGSIPAALALCNNLQVVNLSENMFTGGIPSSLGAPNLPRLRCLNVRGNWLAGRAPPLTHSAIFYWESNPGLLPSKQQGKMKYAKKFKMAAQIAALSNSVPKQQSLAASLVKNSTKRDSEQQEMLAAMEANEETMCKEGADARIALAALHRQAGGARWRQREGWPGGDQQLELARWWGVWALQNRVLSLNLSNNNLVGVLPDCLNVLENLVQLNVSENPLLRGSIPDSIALLPRLGHLDLTGCAGLGGALPARLAERPGLALMMEGTGVRHGAATAATALYPLYLAPSAALLALGNGRAGRLPAHAAARARGAVVRLVPKAESPMQNWFYRPANQSIHVEVTRSQMAFISHRWLSPDHPDDEQNSKMHHLFSLVQRYPWIKFWWIDYMCCPQKEDLPDNKHTDTFFNIHRANAINSMPHYIKACANVFFLKQGLWEEEEQPTAGWYGPTPGPPAAAARRPPRGPGARGLLGGGTGGSNTAQGPTGDGDGPPRSQATSKRAGPPAGRGAPRRVSWVRGDEVDWQSPRSGDLLESEAARTATEGSAAGKFNRRGWCILEQLLALCPIQLKHQVKIRRGKKQSTTGLKDPGPGVDGKHTRDPQKDISFNEGNNTHSQTKLNNKTVGGSRNNITNKGKGGAALGPQPKREVENYLAEEYDEVVDLCIENTCWLACRYSHAEEEISGLADLLALWGLTAAPDPLSGTFSDPSDRERLVPCVALLAEAAAAAGHNSGTSSIGHRQGGCLDGSHYTAVNRLAKDIKSYLINHHLGNSAQG